MKKLDNRGTSHVLIGLFIVVAVAIGGVYFMVASHAQYGLRIYDISYPQCTKKVYKKVNSSLGVVGLNRGHPKSSNPCFKRELNQFKTVSIYVNASYTGQHTKKGPCSAKTTACYAQNTGALHADYDLKLAKRNAGSKIMDVTWWIDVEQVNPWSGNKDANREYLRAMAQRLRDAGINNVGYYSTGYQWGVITGGWQSNGPVWYAKGPASRREVHDAEDANRHCSAAFNGGKVWMVQYLSTLPDGTPIDLNYVCGDAF